MLEKIILIVKAFYIWVPKETVNKKMSIFIADFSHTSKAVSRGNLWHEKYWERKSIALNKMETANSGNLYGDSCLSLICTMQGYDSLFRYGILMIKMMTNSNYTSIMHWRLMLKKRGQFLWQYCFLSYLTCSFWLRPSPHDQSKNTVSIYIKVVCKIDYDSLDVYVVAFQ